jgi:PAS domain S-box-containing protein
MLDVEGIIRQVNQTELDMLGYTRDEMLGKPIFEFVMPEQRDEAEGRFRRKLTGKEIPKQGNRKYLKKNGSEVNVSIDDMLERDTDGKVLGVRTTMVNITDLKRAQEELRHLSAQLLEVQENERKKLSRELHDSTGQLLAALRFGVENALDKVRHGTIGESVELLETVIPLVQQASDEVRRIHTDLRPSLIDDLGIVATISWFCREFETLHAGVRMEQMIHIEEKEVPEPLKIVIFRILQEALNNIAKYGKANQVRVFLREKDGKLELAIEDNGQGFDVEHVRSEKNADRGVGLISMKERADLSGGSFSIESKKGAGTTVRASWPYGSEKSIS